jgi:large subunit ribosomal protein L13
MQPSRRNPLSTYYAKPGEVEREWLLVDATDMVLGRLASEVAQILKGKRKPQYTPNVDVGDFVIVINAEKVRLTGNKALTKNYYSHSGYPGGLKEVSYQRMLEKHPERIIEKAVKGMLPKNTLGRAMGKKLKVYAGPHHHHEAQKPRQITLEG